MLSALFYLNFTLLINNYSFELFDFISITIPHAYTHCCNAFGTSPILGIVLSSRFCAYNHGSPCAIRSKDASTKRKNFRWAE